MTDQFGTNAALWAVPEELNNRRSYLIVECQETHGWARKKAFIFTTVQSVALTLECQNAEISYLQVIRLSFVKFLLLTYRLFS